MFTGIVREVGVVREATLASGRARLLVQAERLVPEVAAGDSVAVDGACLTVAGGAPGSLLFDVVPDTLAATTLGDLRPGDRVNLEPALRVGERLSGHFVTGHVDGVGELIGRRDEPGQVRMRFSAPEAVRPFLMEKGAITVAGLSLTVRDVSGPEFSVSLVPHTLRVTTLEEYRPGRRVNLEADVLARWVARLLPGPSGPGPGITLDKLREAGFEVG